MNKYFDDPSKNRGKTLQDHPKRQHPEQRKDAQAESMYAATTPGRKETNGPERLTGQQRAQRDWEKRQAAAKFNDDLARSSGEQDKLNARYGATTKVRNGSVESTAQKTTWATTKEAQADNR